MSDPQTTLPPQIKLPSFLPQTFGQWVTVLGPYIALILITLLFAALTWWYQQRNLFFTLRNLRLITLHASVTATGAIGMTVIMISGGIDLSVGYVVSLVTVNTLLVYKLAYSLPFFAETASCWAILAGLGTGALVGFTNGVVITKLKVIPFVATLGMMGVARGLGQYLAAGQVVRFPVGSTKPYWITWFSDITPQPQWLIIGPGPWSVLLLAILAAIFLRYTVLGRYCYAIGSNGATARLCGIRVDQTKILLYTLAGLATGWAGIIQTARSGNGIFDVQAGLELEVIAAVVIGGGSLTGGIGTISGTIVGALILGVLANGCAKLGLQNEFRFMVIGVTIVGVAALNAWRQKGMK